MDFQSLAMRALVSAALLSSLMLVGNCQRSLAPGESDAAPGPALAAQAGNSGPEGGTPAGGAEVSTP